MPDQSDSEQTAPPGQPGPAEEPQWDIAETQQQWWDGTRWVSASQAGLRPRSTGDATDPMWTGLDRVSPPPQAPESETVIAAVGDIRCTQAHVITPSGTYSLGDTIWTVQNHTVMSESIPAYAVILAIVFFIFCLLGLLFLLIKQRRVTGYVQVSVQGPGLYHATQIPVASTAAIADVEARVNYIRGLVAAVPRGSE